MKTNLANCKRLYELSGWKPSPYQSSDNGKTPLYDFDYLLGKLPRRNNHGYLTITVTDVGEMWASGYWDDSENKFTLKSLADTPADALTLLAIQLFENGVLK